MAAFKVPLKIYQGETLRKLRTWKSGTPAVPVDLTGCTARMQIRTSVKAATTLASLTTENGGLILGDDAGTITIYMSATATAALTGWTSAVYDLEIVFGGGDVRRLMEGSVTLLPEVTR